MKFIYSILLLSLVLVCCGERDPLDIPYAEFSTSDSAAGMKLLNSITREELKLMTIGLEDFARDTNELKRKTIRQMIERGREIEYEKGARR
jgi:hypothetical protein